MKRTTPIPKVIPLPYTTPLERDEDDRLEKSRLADYLSKKDEKEFKEGSGI